MTEHKFFPEGVCARCMNFKLDDENRIHDLDVIGGCSGNLRAISKLVEGMEATKVIDLLQGNRCGSRPTSCMDQLTIGLKEAMAEKA